MLLFKRSCITFLILFMGFSSFATADDYAADYKRLWQLKRLFSPSVRQVKMEQHQRIFTYIGLTDKEVDQAMDENFDRIESFLMANIIITDEKGKPKRNPKTGEVLTEEDGC